jgi:hypothetical protein
VNVSNGPITRYRKELRTGLVVLAAPLVVTGGWALLGPHSWYDHFPGAGVHWVKPLGPYDEHLVRDFGALYLAFGLLLGFAAVALDRLLVRAALGASLVVAVPHFIFHAANTEPFSTQNNVANLIVLAGAIVLPVLMLYMIAPRAQDAGESAPRGEPTTEGGVTYGTR